MPSNGGPCLIYVEELAEKRTVPFNCLRPAFQFMPQNYSDTKPYRYHNNSDNNYSSYNRYSNRFCNKKYNVEYNANKSSRNRNSQLFKSFEVYDDDYYRYDCLAIKKSACITYGKCTEDYYYDECNDKLCGDPVYNYYYEYAPSVKEFYHYDPYDLRQFTSINNFKPPICEYRTAPMLVQNSHRTNNQSASGSNPAATKTHGKSSNKTGQQQQQQQQQPQSATQPQPPTQNQQQLQQMQQLDNKSDREKNSKDDMIKDNSSINSIEPIDSALDHHNNYSLHPPHFEPVVNNFHPSTSASPMFGPLPITQQPLLQPPHPTAHHHGYEGAYSRFQNNYSPNDISCT